jgi:uncharacterized protein
LSCPPRSAGACRSRSAPASYQALQQWMASFGRLAAVGVEGTSSYGAGRHRLLTAAGVVVVEVDRPDRSARRSQVSPIRWTPTLRHGQRHRVARSGPQSPATGFVSGTGAPGDVRGGNVVDMPFRAPPRTAAWAHQDVRVGFEVVYFQPVHHGHVVTGWTTAVEGGQTWVVDYTIRVDADWRTQGAEVHGSSGAGALSLALETDGDGRWQVNGVPAPYLDGCMDVDLESSAMTNALPVHRLALEPGERAAAPAAYVGAVGLTVERLEQSYVRTDDDNPRQRYEYAAPAFDFSCQLVYDAAGLVLTYPGIARRAR